VLNIARQRGRGVGCTRWLAMMVYCSRMARPDRSQSGSAWRGWLLPPWAETARPRCPHRSTPPHDRSWGRRSMMPSSACRASSRAVRRTRGCGAANPGIVALAGQDDEPVGSFARCHPVAAAPVCALWLGRRFAERPGLEFEGSGPGPPTGMEMTAVATPCCANGGRQSARPSSASGRMQNPGAQPRPRGRRASDAAFQPRKRATQSD
jgi:hypothetical protein